MGCYLWRADERRMPEKQKVEILAGRDLLKLGRPGRCTETGPWPVMPKSGNLERWQGMDHRAFRAGRDLPAGRDIKTWCS